MKQVLTNRPRSRFLHYILVLTCFCCAVAGQSWATSVAVPSSPEGIIREASFIALGVLATNDQGEHVFKVYRHLTEKDTKEEVLRFAPEYLDLVDLRKMETRTAGMPTIFLGMKDDNRLLIARFANSSFWPQGLPDNRAEEIRAMDIEKITEYISKVREVMPKPAEEKYVQANQEAEHRLRMLSEVLKKTIHTTPSIKDFDPKTILITQGLSPNRFYKELRIEHRVIRSMLKPDANGMLPSNPEKIDIEKGGFLLYVIFANFAPLIEIDKSAPSSITENAEVMYCLKFGELDGKGDQKGAIEEKAIRTILDAFLLTAN